MRGSILLVGVSSIVLSRATYAVYNPRDDNLRGFNPDDPASLLLGLPSACVADPVANEHICTAWQEGIMRHNLLDNITVIWTADRPSYFPSEEENAADQVELDAMNVLTSDLMNEEEGEDDEDGGGENDENDGVEAEEGLESHAASTLEKRRKHPKHSTTTITTQKPEETGRHHRGKKKPHKTTSSVKPKHTKKKGKKKKPHKTSSAKPEKTGKHDKDKKEPVPCPCCYNEKRILCCVTSPLMFNVPCCLKQQKHCHKEQLGIGQAKCLCSGLDDCKEKGYWKKVTKPKC